MLTALRAAHTTKGTRTVLLEFLATNEESALMIDEPPAGENAARKDTEADELAGFFLGAAGGERDAFRRWVERVTPTVYRLSLRLGRRSADAEDVVQEAMVRAWQSMQSLREPRASLGWVCQIARNVARDHARREKRSPCPPSALDAERASSWVERLCDPSASSEDLAGSEEARALVRAAIDSLPEKHRLPLLLCELDGMSGSEAAAALGCPKGTVDSRLHRARAALGKKIRGMAGRRPAWRLFR